MTEPDPHRTPGIVIAAVAAATVVVPFLIVYAFLFIMRGLFVQVEQPDITATRSGEAVAGFVALAFLILVLWGMLRLLNGSNRLIFWAGQLITAGAAALVPARRQLRPAPGAGRGAGGGVAGDRAVLPAARPPAGCAAAGGERPLADTGPPDPAGAGRSGNDAVERQS